MYAVIRAKRNSHVGRAWAKLPSVGICAPWKEVLAEAKKLSKLWNRPVLIVQSQKGLLRNWGALED